MCLKIYDYQPFQASHYKATPNGIHPTMKEKFVVIYILNRLCYSMPIFLVLPSFRNVKMSKLLVIPFLKKAMQNL